MKQMIIFVMVISLTVTVGSTQAQEIRLLGHCDLGAAYGITVSGDYAYIAGVDGLYVISVVNSENPEEVGYCDTPGGAFGVAVSGDYAYVADTDCGLRIISIFDPENPEEAGYYDTPGIAAGVTVSGDYAYVADARSGLRVISVFDPENPEEVGYYDTDGEAQDVTVSGDYAYLAEGGVWNGETFVGSGLRIFDISDPEEPSELGHISGPSIDVTVSDDYAYVSTGRFLRVISVSDPENPEGVGYIRIPDMSRGVAVSGNYCYIGASVADEPNGLRVISVANPEYPEEVVFYITGGDAFNVFISDDLAYIADGRNGLLILDISDFMDSVEDDCPIANEYYLSQAYPNPFNPVTTLSYGLPVPTEVSVIVCDVSGRLVTTLVSGHQTVGQHNIVWNAQSIPTGVYLVKMEADAFSAVQKVVLVK